MKIKIFPLLLIFIFLFIFIIFFKGLQNSNIYSPKNNFQNNVPSFETELFLKKKKISSKEIFSSNNFYLMNIWSSWCVPCREEHKFLMRLSKKKNLSIVGLNYKDKSKNAKNFLNQLGNPYNVIMLDKNGTLAIEWGAYGVPETFLIQNKKILKKFVGPIDETSMAKIEEIIQ